MDDHTDSIISTILSNPSALGGIGILVLLIAIGIGYVFILVQSDSSGKKLSKNGDSSKGESKGSTEETNPKEIATSASNKAKPNVLLQTFQLAVKSVSKGPKPKKDPDMNTKFQLYAYYKQSTEGVVKGTRPGVFSVVDRSKYDAWAALGNMSKEEAQQKYIDIVKDMFGGTLPFAPDPVSSAEAKDGEGNTTETNLEDDFKLAVTAIGKRLKNLGKSPESSKIKDKIDSKIRYKLYAYYKQATEGQNNEPRPRRFRPAERWKHDAWAALKDMSKDEAKRNYVDLVKRLYGGSIPTEVLYPKHRTSFS